MDTQHNPTVFGALDLTERLPAPNFNKTESIALCHLWEKIPGLRDSIDGLTKTKAISRIIFDLSEYRAHGPQADTAQLEAFQKTIHDLTEKLNAADATIESHEATILKIKQEHEAALDIANGSLREKATAADNEIMQLAQKLQAAEKLAEELKKKAEESELQDNQVVISVLPELLQKTRNPEVYKLMVQRGYINSADNSPSTLFNLALKEFLRVFFGI